MKHFFILATGQVTAGCSSLVLNDQQDAPTVTIPDPTWLQTPSIVKISDGKKEKLFQEQKEGTMFFTHDQIDTPPPPPTPKSQAERGLGTCWERNC